MGGVEDAENVKTSGNGRGEERKKKKKVPESDTIFGEMDIF